MKIVSFTPSVTAYGGDSSLWEGAFRALFKFAYALSKTKFCAKVFCPAFLQKSWRVRAEPGLDIKIFFLYNQVLIHIRKKIREEEKSCNTIPARTKWASCPSTACC